MESIQRNLAPLALRHQLSLVLPFSSATGLAYPALPDLAPSALRRQVSLALPNFFINNIVLCQQNSIPLLNCNFGKKSIYNKVYFIVNQIKEQKKRRFQQKNVAFTIFNSY